MYLLTRGIWIQSNLRIPYTLSDLIYFHNFENEEKGGTKSILYTKKS